MDPFSKIGRVEEFQEIPKPRNLPSDVGGVGSFADALKQAITEVDHVQKESDAAQVAFTQGEEIDLHNVMIKIEEAEIAFKAMMEVRTKILDAYREVMRLGSGG